VNVLVRLGREQAQDGQLPRLVDREGAQLHVTTARARPGAEEQPYGVAHHAGADRVSDDHAVLPPLRRDDLGAERCLLESMTICGVLG
jgi:hypothetical protein